MEAPMNCLKCSTKIKPLHAEYGTIICPTCNFKYLVVESIPIMVNEETDFYRYARKFKRFVDLKNE